MIQRRAAGVGPGLMRELEGSVLTLIFFPSHLTQHSILLYLQDKGSLKTKMFYCVDDMELTFTVSFSGKVTQTLHFKKVKLDHIPFSKGDPFADPVSRGRTYRVGRDGDRGGR